MVATEERIGEPLMSYIRTMQRDAFKDSKLENSHAHTQVAVYKLTPADRFHWCYIIFTPIGIMVGGDQRFGDTAHGMAVSVAGLHEPWFASDLEEDYLGEKFFGRKPTGPKALRAWTNDVGWLAALQQEFKRLYLEMMDKTVEVK